MLLDLARVVHADALDLVGLGAVPEEFEEGAQGAVAVQPVAEFRERIAGFADLTLDGVVNATSDYQPVRWERALRDMEACLGPAAAILEEPALRDVEGETRRILRRVNDENPRGARWPADSLLARLCYLSCRLIDPEVVIETGVAYGVSSAFILKALQENDRGTLYSIDLPPLRRGYEKFWGIAVPDA